MAMGYVFYPTLVPYEGSIMSPALFIAPKKRQSLLCHDHADRCAVFAGAQLDQVG